jgi:hypothetical protein
MNVQQKIEKWCRNERFVHYANERISEELVYAPNHRILPVGGTPEDKDRWTEYYHIYQCAIDATKDAYMPNAQRKKEYLRIYEDITRQNEILVGYLAKRQNTTITSTLLNATAAAAFSCCSSVSRSMSSCVYFDSYSSLFLSGSSRSMLSTAE